MIEPAWKLLLSSKAILPLLWEFFPNHPNLLPAFDGGTPNQGQWVQKPIYSREGANISIVHDGSVLTSSDGTYGDQPLIHQAQTDLFHQDGVTAVIGSWVIGDQAAGIGIREEEGAITTNGSRFIPHYFEQ